jgi:hypothetical protein
MQLPHCQSPGKTCYAVDRPALWGGDPAACAKEG